MDDSKKIVAVVYVDYCKFVAMTEAGALLSTRYAHEMQDMLASRRQRLEIPVKPQLGWVGIPEDAPLPPPLPELWINVYPNIVTNGHGDRATADHVASSVKSRIAVIHLWTDRFGTDHAEIERV